jgi:hypothetical protein
MGSLKYRKWFEGFFGQKLKAPTPMETMPEDFITLLKVPVQASSSRLRTHERLGLANN